MSLCLCKYRYYLVQKKWRLRFLYVFLMIILLLFRSKRWKYKFVVLLLYPPWRHFWLKAFRIQTDSSGNKSIKHKVNLIPRASVVSPVSLRSYSFPWDDQCLVSVCPCCASGTVEFLGVSTTSWEKRRRPDLE